MPTLTVVSPNDTASLPVQLVLDHSFACTPAQLFASFQRADDWKVWLDLDVSPMTEGPYREGYTRKAKSGPLTLEEHFTVWEPNRTMAFYVERSNHPFMTAFAEHYAVTPTPTGCSLSWRIGMAFRRFDLLSGPLVKRSLRSAATTGFPKLEALALQG
jgi:hypothetical protein